VAAGGDERRGDFLAFLRAEVDLDRALALVEPGPEKALAVLAEWPAVRVEPAADLVETNDVGTELRQRHAAERRGDERRAFDDAEALEDAGGHANNPMRRQSSTSETRSPMLVAFTWTRRWTRPPPEARASLPSTVISECSVSPSRTGPRWS